MSRRNLCPAGGSACGCAMFIFAALLGAAGAEPASAAAPVVPVGATVDAFDVGTARESFGIVTDGRAASLTVYAAADADPPPAVAPLPPALSTALTSLAAMLVLRAGRRVYRRA